MKCRTGYIFKHGAGYSLRWVVNGKRFVRALRYSEGDRKGEPIRDLRDAEVARAKIMAPFAVGNQAEVLEHLVGKLATAKAEVALIEERAPALALSDAWQAYLAAGNRGEIGAGTLANYEGYWNAFTDWMTNKAPDTKELRAATFQQAQGYVGHLLARGVTGRTINAHRAFLRAFWNVLGEMARIEGNPWAKIAKRAEHSNGRRALSVEELRTVCGKADGELRRLLALGLYLGARLGDAATMGWECVDMTRREIAYVPRKTAGKVGRVLHIPIHRELLAILDETPRTRRKGPICPDMAERYATRGADGVSDLVQRHFEACGLVTTEDRPGAGIRRRVAVGFHSLRHATVSMLRAAGVVQSISMEIAGHTDANVHSLYTHTDGDAMRRAVNSLPRMIAGPAKREPAARVARLLKKVKSMTPANLKRVVLRTLRAQAKKLHIVAT